MIKGLPLIHINGRKRIDYLQFRLAEGSPPYKYPLQTGISDEMGSLMGDWMDLVRHLLK